RSPRGVACITFSQECARELLRRLEKLGLRESSRLFIGTLHGFCLRHLLIPYARLAALGLPDPIKVAPAEHCNHLHRQLSEDLFGRNDPYSKLAMDSHHRTHIDRTQPAWQAQPELVQLAEAYERELHGQGFVDYEDLVIYGE